MAKPIAAGALLTNLDNAITPIVKNLIEQGYPADEVTATLARHCEVRVAQLVAEVATDG